MELGVVSSFFTTMPTDIVIIGTFALLMLIDALRVGSGRIASLAIAALVALVVVGTLPSAAFFGGVSATLSTPVLQAAMFGVLFFFIFILVRRIFIDYGEENGLPLQALFAAIAVTALVVLVWVQVPALSAVWTFGPQIQSFFSEPYRLWWIIASISALAFAKA